jgi:acyl-coenzyme A synthetase/AMP-(fatty) acid ligase
MNNRLTKNFLANVHSNPYQIAICDSQQSYTYQQLYDLAKKNSQILKNIYRNSPGRNVLMLIADRSLHTVIWMISSILAGIPFLNVNEKYPESYLLKTLAEIDPKAYIMTGKSNFHSSLLNGNRVINKKKITLYSYPQLELMESSVEGGGPVYMVRTSGTTGNPKTSIILHSCLENYTKAIKRYHELKKTNHVCLSHLEPNFDIFIKEILLPLQFGATVYLANETEKNDPFLFASLINRLRPHWLNITFSFYENISDLLKTNVIRHLIFVGEKVNNITSSLFEIACHAWNEYGPSECTLGFTLKKLEKKFINTAPSIGKALLNNKVYVLDINENKELPFNQTGEFVLTGKNLGAGYLLEDEEKKFATRLITLNNGTTLTCYSYRSGDLGYKDENNNLHYISRLGSLIKIRGQFVDLQALAREIQTLPFIKSARVEYCNFIGEYYSILAYVILKENKLDSPEKLIREFLKNHHLQYEIPDYIIPISSWPTNLNGKINRLALREIAKTHFLT